MPAAALTIRHLKQTRVQAGTSDAYGDRDHSLLIALADEQLRYGQSEEALVLLQICQTFRPQDPDVIRRLARVFIALDEFAAADAMVAALERLPQPVGPHPGEMLLRATILRGLNRAADAFTAFRRYLSLAAGKTMP